MLDHKNRQTEIIADLADKCGQFIGFLRVHTCCRLIQKKQLWLCRKGTRNLQTSLFSIGKRGRHLVTQVFKPHDFQKLLCFLAHLRLLFSIQMKSSGKQVAGSSHMLCNQNVFKYSLALKQSDILERSGNAKLCDLIRSRCQHMRIHIRILSLVELLHFSLRMIFDNLLTIEIYRSICRRIYTCYHVESRRFSGAVWTDQRNDLAFVYYNVHIVNCNHAAKLHGYIFNLQYMITHWSRLLLLLFSFWISP